MTRAPALVLLPPSLVLNHVHRTRSRRSLSPAWTRSWALLERLTGTSSLRARSGARSSTPILHSCPISAHGCFVPSFQSLNPKPPAHLSLLAASHTVPSDGGLLLACLQNTAASAHVSLLRWPQPVALAAASGVCHRVMAPAAPRTRTVCSQHSSQLSFEKASQVICLLCSESSDGLAFTEQKPNPCDGLTVLVLPSWPCLRLSPARQLWTPGLPAVPLPRGARAHLRVFLTAVCLPGDPAPRHPSAPPNFCAPRFLRRHSSDQS